MDVYSMYVSVYAYACMYVSMIVCRSSAASCNIYPTYLNAFPKFSNCP